MGSAALVVGLLLTVAASRAVFATHHVVGDSAGWSKTTDYVAWAANKPFIVGDTLVFNYGREDLVYEVTEDDYKSCTIGKPKHINHGHGQTIVPLDKPGPMYFLSPTFGHCTIGMKLAININPITTSGTTTSLTLTTIMSKQTQLPPALPSLTCPGGGGLSPPFNPGGGGGGDDHSPPNPYGPNRGGATSMGKINIFTSGFYSLLVLIVSFMA